MMQFLQHRVRLAVLGLWMSIFLAPVAACSQTPNPIPVGTDTTYYGNIATGGKFGVKIGDSRAAARATLEKQGFLYFREGGCSHRVRTLTACAGVLRTDLYDVDQFLRRGLLVLVLDGERIGGMVWDFQALPATDF